VVIFVVIIGGIMMRLNQQPQITPAAATGSMQGQLSQQTNPKR
jgi:hypothetical protein